MQTQNNLLKFSGKIVIIFSLFLLSITSCKKEKVETTDKAYRTIAWNYLSKAQQATVNTKWEDAPIEKKTDNGQEIVIVTFGTTQDAILGPIQVFVDVKTKSALGIGGRF
jgi:hypothetical protein